MDTRIGLDAVCVPSEDVVARQIEGMIVIVPLVAGIGDADDELYTLNETGQAIWQRLDGVRTLNDVVTDLEPEFDADRGDLETDVLGFAVAMVDRGILSTKA
ncbi:MAG: PqqD family protein [Actinobacteria bacterium]|nr:PqqD family protein [Actinomycetota bacterium]